MAQPTPEQLQYQRHSNNDSRAAALYGTASSMASAAVVAVVLRLICRRRLKMVLSYDDYTILFALVRSHHTPCDTLRLMTDDHCDRSFWPSATTSCWRLVCPVFQSHLSCLPAQPLPFLYLSIQSRIELLLQSSRALDVSR